MNFRNAKIVRIRGTVDDWTPWFRIALLSWLIPAIAALSAAPVETRAPIISTSGMIPDLPSPGLLFRIVRQNLLMILVNLSGYVTFEATSVLNLVVNGLTLGVATRSALAVGGTWHEIARSTLPHSIELLGLWLSGSMGLQGASHGYQFTESRLNGYNSGTYSGVVP